MLFVRINGRLGIVCCVLGEWLIMYADRVELLGYDDEIWEVE